VALLKRSGSPWCCELLHDESAIYHSAPSIAAVLTADKLDGRGMDLLARIQSAHY
jgi:putative protein-disulfide isomerase